MRKSDKFVECISIYFDLVVAKMQIFVLRILKEV